MLNAPKTNVLYLFGISFILKMLVEAIIGPSVFVSLGIVFFFLLGFLIVFVADRLTRPKEVLLPPVIETAPVHEDNAFVELDRMMKENRLELRLRRVDDVWQVTFIAHDGPIIRIAGMGSAASVLDAIIKAEADFLEKAE